MNAVVKEETKLVKLDIGCGPNPKEGYVGLDILDFGKSNITKCNLGVDPWPFEDDSVSESHCAHFLEHLTNLNDKWERVHFFNELWRVTVKGGKCDLILPHWASNRYYGDPTHKEPFSEMGFFYLDPNWRKPNAPHADSEFSAHGYKCHWACTWGYTMNGNLVGRSAEYQNFATANFKEACLDMIATMVAVK